MFRPKYEQADKHEKTDIAKHIVNIIHESHGRFLKFEESEGCWMEVENGVAREKISHIFRNQRHRNKGMIATKTSHSHIMHNLDHDARQPELTDE
jgi:hypothetical protein